MLLIRGFRHTRCHEDYRNIKVPYTYGKVLVVEQDRMANAQLLGYGSKHLGQNFFF